MLLDNISPLLDGVYFLLDAAPDARRDETRAISPDGERDAPPRRSSK